jgi:hypothetical protein
MSFRDGDPIECPCKAPGGLVVLFREPIWGRAGTGERIKIGERFHYRCDRCRREVDVRWSERNVRAPSAKRQAHSVG